jgi:hypothetical protein
MLIFLPRLTLLVKTGSPSDLEKKHYYVVLTDPVESLDGDSYVAWVSWRSLEEGRFYDNACVLDVGDHIKIKRRSWVDYSFAEIKSVSEIKKGIAGGTIKQCDPISEDVYRRFVAGIPLAKHIDDEVTEFCDRHIDH